MAEPRPLRGVVDEAGLRRWGEAIGRETKTPQILALHGDLGAGKSTFARAVARGAGVAGLVPSPTYNLQLVYPLPRGGALRHLDLYRIDHQDQVWELGWAELGDPGEIVLIEWAENAAAILPSPRWEVMLEEADDPSLRTVEAVAVGDPPPLPPLSVYGG